MEQSSAVPGLDRIIFYQGILSKLTVIDPVVSFPASEAIAFVWWQMGNGLPVTTKSQ